MKLICRLTMALLLLLAMSSLAARADGTPSPSPSPSATPSPAPKRGFSLGLSGSHVFVLQSASGPGITPPEGPAFANGDPVSPMSPYDWFSSAPQAPGLAGVAQYALTASYRARSITASATFDFVGIAGDKTNAAFWGEPLYGNASPHFNRLYDPGIVFPTAPGQNDIFGGKIGVPYSASVSENSGAWQLNAGYFNLAQTDHFVFFQPPSPNAPNSAGVQSAETLGPGMPNLDSWSAAPTSLPILGLDAQMKVRGASIELSDGLLPALARTGVRLTNGSIAIDRGDSGKYTFQISHIDTTGDPIGTTTFFGTNQTLMPGVQGRLFTSNLADQHQTLAGMTAFVHPFHNDDVLVELGRGWYHAGLVAQPGTSRPGNYQHYAFTHHFNSQTDFGIEYYRFDPRYAVINMPYGVPENIWSIAWSWPGQWLKSTYQSIDNSIIGINRAGYRAHADTTHGRLALHAEAYVWRQLEPITIANASQEGWIDGFFLPQVNGNATHGWQRQAGLYAAWHLPNDDLVFDSVWDRSYRPIKSDPVDFVSMNYPQIVFSVQHHFNKNALAVIGYGRYSANGTWSTTPVLGIYGVGFIGGQWNFGGQQLMVQLRRQGLTGLPSIPGGPSPTLTGTTLVVDQRFSI